MFDDTQDSGAESPDQEASSLTPDGDPWPDPDASLFGNYGELPDFPVDLLPGAIRPFIKHLAKTMHSPPEFIAIPALCAAGAMLGRKVRIQMKQVDGGWKERAALWGAVIAPPGSMKSPCAQHALAPVIELQKRLLERHRQQIRAIQEDPSYDPKRTPLPPEETILINDATGEAVTLAMSPDFNGGDARGVLLFRDELSGWFESLNKYREGDDRQIFLEAWSGGSFHRKLVKGPVHVPDCFLSLYGTVQPAVAYKVFGAAKEDGLMPRFGLVAVRPEAGPKLVDIAVDPRVIADYNLAITQLREVPDRLVKFSPEAYSLFAEWYEELAKKQAGIEAPFKYHFLKYPALLGRLSLVFHFLKHGPQAPERVGEGTLKAVIRLIDRYLEPHARRLYGVVSANELFVGAQRIARWIVSSGVETFRIRDIQRRDWREFPRADARELIRRTLDYLEAKDWIRWEQVPTGPAGGQPTEQARVNPKVFLSEDAREAA
jgi:hypothetical protein